MTERAKTLLSLIAFLALMAGIFLLGAHPADAGEEPTHDVPHWMTRVCDQEDSVNCWWDGGVIKPHAGKMFIRKIPHTSRVCYLFVNTPSRDYCTTHHD